jgi:hypothetical protein
MMMRGLIIAAALLFPYSAVAEVDMNSANYQLPHCRDYQAIGNAPIPDYVRLYAAALCGGQIKGIAISLHLTGQICEPDGVTNGQVLSVVMTYIDRTPERQHESFSVLAIEALKRAWPCRH